MFILVKLEVTKILLKGGLKHITLSLVAEV